MKPCVTRRKCTATSAANEFASPYINHLIDVLDILWRVGGVRDPVTLIGGILHDTLEDTAATQDEIRSRFGDEVLAVVLEVTDDKTLPKAERERAPS